MFVHHGIPWLGEKALEMGKYYGSEALRNPKLQKKAIDTLAKQICNILEISRIFLELLQKLFLEISRIFQFSILEISRKFYNVNETC